MGKDIAIQMEESEDDVEMNGGKPQKAKSSQAKVTEFFPNKKKVQRAGNGAVTEGQHGEKTRERKQRASAQSCEEHAVVKAGGEAKVPEHGVAEQRYVTVPDVTDEVEEGAALLLAFSSAQTAKPEGKPKPAGRNSISAACAGSADDAPPVQPPESGEGWAWEPSCHPGLLTYHDGRKRWYHCTQCKYFNDRLYHSKMHYQRIHLNNGKSMPRKRKYMEPAGNVMAGEAASLPPQHVQQPQPKYTRTRQPGDKWLKTVADKDAASPGFRYQSVKENIQQGNDSAALTSGEDDEVPPSTPSDDLAMSADERERIEERLSTPEKKLYCWESSKNAIQRGVDKGSVCRKFKSVYSFQNPTVAPPVIATSAAAAITSAAPPLKRPGPLGVITSPSVVHVQSCSVSGVMLASLGRNGGCKQQTWWWHKTRGAGGGAADDLSEDGDSNASSRDAENEIQMYPPPSNMQMNMKLEAAVCKSCPGVPRSNLEGKAPVASSSAASSSQGTSGLSFPPDEGEASVKSFPLAAIATAEPVAPRKQQKAPKRDCKDKTVGRNSISASCAGADQQDDGNARIKEAPAKTSKSEVLKSKPVELSVKTGAIPAPAVQTQEATSSSSDDPCDTGKNGFANKKAVIPVALSGGVGGGGAADASSSRGKKRVWKRWDATEEEALQRAVEMHGTKDWTAIKQEMKTDRSVKQLQDHWNDTKTDRKHTPRV